MDSILCQIGILALSYFTVMFPCNIGSIELFGLLRHASNAAPWLPYGISRQNWRFAIYSRHASPCAQDIPAIPDILDIHTYHMGRSEWQGLQCNAVECCTNQGDRLDDISYIICFCLSDSALFSCSKQIHVMNLSLKYLMHFG